MSGRTPIRKIYQPLLLDFPHIPPAYCYRCPFNKEYPGCGVRCAWELERVIKLEDPSTVSAFICEPVPVSHMTGAMPPPEYFQTIRQICDEYNIVMIIDEVITGFGRLGKNFVGFFE